MEYNSFNSTEITFARLLRAMRDLVSEGIILVTRRLHRQYLKIPRIFRDNGVQAAKGRQN